MGALSELISLGWFLLTIVLYVLMKSLYKKQRKWWLMPMVSVPTLLITCLLLTQEAFNRYYADTRWLVWMLGPATVAFAVPIYEQRKIIYRYWMTLSIGVIVGAIVAVLSSVFLARLFGLPTEIQASLAPRSVSTPFAILVAPKLGGSADLAAIFVVLTGVLGMFLGQVMLVLLPVRSRLAKGALYGASAHGCGTARAMELGNEIGVIASLVMMISGVVTVFAYPLIKYLIQ
ncbi:LrgB family protein [Neisseria sp. Ec49-e6-T10]|uniref:LrgB family protein n=1 Tax=Neisseria sp. Ec49-e6-T10 TaxID=3140744 RepID=UPI003EC03EA8